MVLGNVLYGLAYRANWLYLILMGRMVTGFGFTLWMYIKRYCSDPRIVGIRRRTTLAGWQVLGQGIGFSLGPFVGGLLYVQMLHLLCHFTKCSLLQVQDWFQQQHLQRVYQSCVDHGGAVGCLLGGHGDLL